MFLNDIRNETINYTTAKKGLRMRLLVISFGIVKKELSLWHKLRFSYTYIFATQSRRPQIIQTMNYVKSNSISLKYQGFPPSDSQDIGIRKFEFVVKTQFLYIIN